LFKKSKVCSAALAALGSLLLVQPQTSFAQAAERVEITGSRIKSLAADSPAPVQSVSAEDIQSSGAVNLQDLLQKNPVLSTPALSRTNSNFSTASAGVSTIDLRNLGSQRTLTLVNGRRFVSGLPGSSAVDLNAIPTDFIERVDLLTGGASSAYGSDAVAGVVNIIYKRNFEGLSLNASTGQSEKSDNKTSTASLTWGVNSANGRGNLMTHLGYSKQGAVFSGKRSISDVDQASTGAFITGEAADLFAVTRPFFSSFAPQGRIFISPGLNAQSRSFDAAGNVVAWSTNGGAGGVGATGYNRSERRTIAIPTERFLFATKGEYNVTESASVFMEGTYALTKTRTRLEPFALNSSDIYSATGGEVPAEFLVNGVLTRNPLVPDSIYNLLGAVRNADGARLYSFTRRLSEVGDRFSVADRNTYRLVTGVRGVLFNVWDYDVYYGYGSTGESQSGNGQVNVASFRNALEAIPGPNGNAICRDALARRQGCVPISVFGFNSITPAAATYVNAPSSLSTAVTQRLFGANVSGELAKLPAGALSMAAGFEYRKETSRSEFDALTQAGLNAGNAQPATRGAFSVNEVYVEVRAPLLKGLPFVDRLEANAAVRAADYSTVGNVTSWNAGVDWTPVSDFRVRTTAAQSTRAPNIDELFQPPQQTFPNGLTDPCVGVTATSTTPVSAACRAATGVAANIAANGGVFTLSQADLQGISGFDRGNPDVLQEVGKSYTVGFVITPSMPALRGFSFTADYFDIKVEDAIVQTPRQFILQQCYSGNTSFCNFIKRRPAVSGANNAGSLEFIDAAVSNSGELVTKGVDLTVGYAGKVGPGAFSGKLSYTHLTDGYLIPLKGSQKDFFAGEVGSPRDRAGLTLSYKWRGFGITSQTTYIGKSALDDQFLADFDVPRNGLTVGAKVYNDFQFTYDWKKTQFYVGIDNAFDTKPAPIITGLPGNITGTETAADVYDAIGRRYYAGVRVSF